MTLTLGTGPFARHRAGSFDAGTQLGEHPVYVEPYPHRVRGWYGGELVVDTRDARLLHEAGALPQWLLPRADLRLLEPTDDVRDDPKGRLRRWSLQLGERRHESAAYDVVEPAAGMPDLTDLVAVDFAALDRWLEEEDEVIGHPRDPYHRVDTRRASEHVVVRAAGRRVADSRRPVKLFETGLPVRWYLPVEDVAQEYLSPSLARTICPYKGIASYWSLTVGGTVVEDAAWGYPDPLGEALQTAGHVCFLGDGVEVTVDGGAG